ncbi:PAS domain S-box protein [Mucilaginibacter ginkgonis]|uniref:PAS domain S-box protein n=1 Tax=Mucilaginibacter ginkgonis TaxID=2682091 RepID=A0A6I4HVD0_9SPHI|nr:PAS domain S-box protein [Mucilaginibacter ginkgonis]QQL49954.1 PAS domain S-box protein [Mucilaginibacter ginkgonis]
MPQRELQRLQEIHRFLNLNIDKDHELQEIAELASELLDCPIALITLMDGETQYFLYKVGTDLKQNAIKDSFCKHLTQENLLIIPDTTKDLKFRNTSCVTASPFIRFYAGAALLTHDQHQLGSICVMGTEPKTLSKGQQHLLKVLAKRVIQITEFEFSINLLKEQFIKSRESEIKLRSFFETSSALHLLVDKNLQVFDFNKNFADFLRQMYDVELMQGLPVGKVLHGEALKSFIGDFEKALNGEMVSFERKVGYRNDQEIWWYVTFEPGLNPEGEIIGISYNALDITERKLNEAQIIAQNKSLREVALWQSHELRRPVATILGLMDIYKARKKSLDKELLMLEKVTKELDERVKEIVGNIDIAHF